MTTRSKVITIFWVVVGISIKKSSPITQKLPITLEWVVAQRRSLALWIPEKKLEE